MERSMNRMAILIGTLGLIIMLMLASSSAHAQATRTWVSGTGNDANPCSRTAPCQTFASAFSKTDAGGEVNCLDPGGFGVLTITKSMTIDCGGTFGSILSSGTNGININGAGANVILRNIVINGAVSGLIGVNFSAGASLTLENVTVMNHNGGSAIGVLFAPNSPNAVLLVNNCDILNNGLAPSTGGGIVVQPAAGGNNALVTVFNSKIQRNGGSGVSANSASGGIIMTLRDSEVSNNTNGGITTAGANFIIAMLDRMTINSNSQSGILSGGAASTVRINNSTVAGNAIGMSTAGGGVVQSFKNNAFGGNGGGEGPFTQATLQ
jgi:hypothetical protein